MRILTGQEIAEQGLDGWADLGNGLYTRVAMSDFASGLALVNAIGEAAKAANQRPALSLNDTSVDIALVDRNDGGVTDQAVALARTITHLVTAAGFALTGASVSRVNLGLDTPDKQTVLPFWRALLAFEDRPGTDRAVRDPAGRLPMVWFQDCRDDEPRQRWHLDVWVDPSQVKPRIDECLAAGGRVVDDSHAPAFWVLADPEGNRSCLATWQDRD